MTDSNDATQAPPFRVESFMAEQALHEPGDFVLTDLAANQAVGPVSEITLKESQIASKERRTTKVVSSGIIALSVIPLWATSKPTVGLLPPEA